MKILLIQGANLNSLGYRQTSNYGDITVEQLNALLKNHSEEFCYNLDIFYTNIEGEAINKIYDSVVNGIDGILVNPAGFTYNAFSLRDCLKYVAPPYVEIHITNTDERKIHSVVSEAAVGIVKGFGIDSYFIALEAMLRILSKKNSNKHD